MLNLVKVFGSLIERYPYGTSLTSSILQVYLKYAKYAYLGQESILPAYFDVPPLLHFKYNLRLGPSTLQVYFKYTWAKPENILEPYLEKYVISIYTSPSTLQEFFSKYSSSALLQDIMKESSPSTRIAFFSEIQRSVLS